MSSRALVTTRNLADRSCVVDRAKGRQLATSEQPSLPRHRTGRHEVDRATLLDIMTALGIKVRRSRLAPPGSGPVPSAHPRIPPPLDLLASTCSTNVAGWMTWSRPCQAGWPRRLRCCGWEPEAPEQQGVDGDQEA